MVNANGRNRKKLWIVVAIACLILLLIATALFLWTRREKVCKTSPVEWSPIYNMRNPHSANVDGYIAGITTAVFSERQISSLTPDRRMEWMQYSGGGSFLDGKCLTATLEVTTQQNVVRVDIGGDGTGNVYSRLDTDIPSNCQDAEYYIYRYTMGDSTKILALTTIGDLPFVFMMETVSSEQDIQDFETVLACFACYDYGLPELP